MSLPLSVCMYTKTERGRVYSGEASNVRVIKDGEVEFYMRHEDEDVPCLQLT